MQTKYINKQIIKDFRLKANEYINKKFLEKKLNNRIFKKNSNFFNKYIFEILLIFLLNILFFSMSTSENNRKTSKVNKISFIVVGFGQSLILSGQVSLPDLVKVNKEEVQLTGRYYEFGELINKVEFTWYSLPSCKQMFEHCTKIVSIDFSKFDSTGITDMSNMFYECTSLEYINFGNSFDTSSVITMENMFYGCSKLIALDLSMFKTESLTTMTSMFFSASSLVSLDLSSFNTTSVENMNNLCYKCEKLVFINLKSFEEKENLCCSNIFSTSMSNVKFCIDKDKSPNINNYISRINGNNVCEDDCFKENYKTIPEKNICINDCQNDEIYSYEDHNICYKNKIHSYYEDEEDDEESDNSEENQKESSDENSVSSEESSESSEESSESSEESSESLEESSESSEESSKSSEDSNESSEESSESSEESSESSEESSESSEESSESSEESSESSEESNESSEESSESSEESSESSEESNESSEESNESSEESSESSEESSESSEESNESSEESNESSEESSESSEESSKSSEDSNESSEEGPGYFESSDNSFEASSPENMENFDALNFFKESKKASNEELTNKDEVIISLKENLINGNLSSLLTDLVNGTKEDLIAEYKDIIYQLTTTENQKDDSYSNISTIDLGECEDKLKGIYGINPNISLIILKIDYKMEGLLIPIIGYEVYNPLNMSQMNLSYCNDINIKLNIPVSIDEDEVEKYDPNSDYYNDNCYAYTTENGTDIILNDRKSEYVDNNLSLCENNCQFNGYDSETKKALCECVTKIEINLISDIISNGNLLSNNLSSSDNSKTNIGTLKCVSLLFSKNGLIKNIGSYLMVLTLIIFAVSIFIFYKCGYELIEQNIKEIITLKTGKKKKEEKRQKNKKKKMKIKKISNPGRKRKKKIKSRKSSMATNKLFISPSKTFVKNTNLIENDEKKISIYKRKSSEKIGKPIKYKESELNLLNYKLAILCDRRTFIEYYNNLNSIKISVLFAFYPMDDYNIKIIKICLFFLWFVIYFSVNTFFFNDNTFHQIYLDGGKYNFIYFLPQIIYSFIICIIINNFIKYFSLSERNFLEIKNENNIKKIKDKADSVKRCLIIKYITFFILSFVFLIVFWYYLSSFCAVYQNTQIYLLINTGISFLIGSLFPLIFNLLPCLIRMNSLKSKNSETLYSISKFIQILLNIKKLN